MIRIHPDQLRDRLVELVHQHAPSGIPDDELIRAVSRDAAEWLDERLRFGGGPVGQIAEAVDGPAARLLIRALAAGVLEAVRRGALDSRR